MKCTTMETPRRSDNSVPVWIVHLVDNLNIEDFITEIEGHPAIWNSSIEDYSNNLATERAWHQICTKLDVNFEQRDAKERNILGKQLHRRWKSLRDSYRRELMKQKTTKSGSAASGRKQYIYFKQLRFLEPVCCVTESSLENEENIEDLEEQVVLDNENSEAFPLPAKRYRKKKDEDSELIQVLKQRVAQAGNESFPVGDPDTLFMMSLVPEIRKIPENQKLLVKTQLMNVILQAQPQNISTGVNIQPPFPQTHMPMHHQPTSYNPLQYYHPQSYQHASPYPNPLNLNTPNCSSHYDPTFQSQPPPLKAPKTSIQPDIMGKRISISETLVNSPHSDTTDISILSNNGESFPYFTQRVEQ